MGSHFVVDLSPDLDQLTGVLQGGKPVRVQALVAQLSVEALDVAVLCRLAWADEVELDLMPKRPLVEMLRCEFRTIVDRDDGRGTALRDDSVEDRRHGARSLRMSDMELFD